MLAKLKTFSLLGIDTLPVDVEVDVSPSGLPKTLLVGLPEAAVKESTHRVEQRIVNVMAPLGRPTRARSMRSATARNWRRALLGMKAQVATTI